MKTKFLIIALLISAGIAAQHLKSFTDLKNGTHYGFKDSITGKIVIPAKYDTTDVFSEDLCAVKMSDKWGFIDTKGVVVIPCVYDFAMFFSEGLAAVVKGGKPDADGNYHNGWGYIDKTGKAFTEFKYEFACPFVDGLASVTLNDHECVLTKGGRVIGGPDFGEVRNSGEGYMRNYFDDKYGILDTLINVILPPTYLGMSAFSEGLAVVDLGVFKGYINTKGELVIPLQFSEASPFENGVATVIFGYDGIETKIDKKGNIIK
ncbi:MAG TPA: WG repeat-containing protein [Bacteroidia bacterium]|jgi:hypothetical protein|nr:WG repeat-containing protein [Bacteroidia bacterium]